MISRLLLVFFALTSMLVKAQDDSIVYNLVQTYVEEYLQDEERFIPQSINDRFFRPNSTQLNYTQTQRWNKELNIFETSSRQIFVFDEKGNPTNATIYTIDSTGKEYTSTSISTEYNEDDNPILQTIEAYNDSLEELIPTIRIYSYYKDTIQLDSLIQEEYSLDSSRWVNGIKSYPEYNEDNKTTYEISYRWNDTIKEYEKNIENYTYYNEDGKVEADSAIYWGFGYALKQTENIREFDEFGRITKRMTYQLNFQILELFEDQEVQYFYETNDAEDTLVAEAKVAIWVDRERKDSIKQEYVYDFRGNQIANILYNSENGIIYKPVSRSYYKYQKTVIGTNDIERKASFTLSPNPAVSFVHIELEEGNHQVVIYSLTGKVMYQDQVNQGKFTLGLSGFSPGTYLVKVDQDEVQKLIIK